jgi:hypothetical protein
MRGALLVSGFATLAGDLTLFGTIHRSKSAIFLGHCSSSRPGRSLVKPYAAKTS